MLHTYLPLQSHVMWDYQWAEEPSFDSAWSTAHKANPLVYNNNRFFCPGSNNISATMGITPGYYAYRWDKDGVIIPGATASNYTATAFGTYRCSFMRTSTSPWSDWSLSPAKIVAVCPPVTGNGTGLAATYFSSNNLTNPVVSRLDPSMNFYIENGASPAQGIAANTNYSVRWTGKIKPNSTTNQVTTTFDWTATILSLAGGKADPALPLDGINIMPVILGKNKEVERTLYWRIFQRRNNQAMRDGKWKWLKDEKDNEYLFDLSNDPSEKNDLKEKFPQISMRLKNKFREWEKTMLTPIPYNCKRDCYYFFCSKRYNLQ